MSKKEFNQVEFVTKKVRNTDVIIKLRKDEYGWLGIEIHTGIGGYAFGLKTGREKCIKTVIKNIVETDKRVKRLTQEYYDFKIKKN